MGQHSNFSKIPNCDDLNPFELALYREYIRTCGWDDPNRECYKSNATLADACQMGTTSVKKSRKSLQEKGYIHVDNVRGNAPARVKLNHDIWDENNKSSGRETTTSGRETTTSGRETTTSGRETTTSGRETTTIKINHQDQSSRLNHQDHHHQDSPTPHPDDDDDFFKFDNLAIEGLFKSAYKRDPKPKERDVLGRILSEPCGNERLTTVLSRIIGQGIVPTTVNYLQTALQNEPIPQKFVAHDPDKFTRGEWAHLIED